MSKWLLIFTVSDKEAQVFSVSGDPQEEAQNLLKRHEWLDGFALVAAVNFDEKKLMIKDDARSDEMGLQKVGI